VSRDPLHRQRSRLVFGAFIVVVGLFALLDNLHVFDSHFIQPFWPLIFVALGAMKLSHARQPGHFTVGIALIVVGAGMTLQNLGLFHLEWRQLWPLALILAGINVISNSSRTRTRGNAGWRRSSGQREERFEHGSRIDASATMSGIVLKNDSKEFAGGEVGVVMGAIEIDLRQASIATEAVLHLSVVMGNIEIKVPPDWSVAVNGSPLMGGIEDKTVPPMSPGKRLVIEGSVVMGGVEISN
jgi:predicted membrane protein